MENKVAVQAVQNLYLQPEMADVNFVFTSSDNTIVKLPAHKIVLSATSEAFGSMFYGNLKEQNEIQIHDADVNAFREFLQFFYLPSVVLSMNNIAMVVYLVSKYIMFECLNTCSSFLQCQINEDNVIWVYQLAISFNVDTLKDACAKYIQVLPSELFKSDEFLESSKDVLEHILDMDRLACSELELFNACIAWAKTACRQKDLDECNPQNLRNELGSCFYSIRFRKISLKEITMILADGLCKNLFSRDDLADILRIKSDEEVVLDFFTNRNRVTPTFYFDDNKLMECVCGTSGQYQLIEQDMESLYFSSDTPLLFGEIGHSHMTYLTHGISNSYIPIKIVEYAEQSFEAGVETKDLLSITLTFISNTNSTFLFVGGPILIHPKRMYEIRFDTSSIRNSHHGYYRMLLNAEYKVESGATITFHRIEGDRTLATKLFFNPI